MNIRNEFLEPEVYYHIYNRGINSENIFNTEENYLFFLTKFNKYVSSVCDILAYCLMPNHFHFLIRVKNVKDLETFVKVPNFDKGAFAVPKFDKSAQGLHSFDSIVSKQIGKFISSYSQAYNKVNNRHGALLESPFKRKRIDTDLYLKNLIVYIHLNPQDFENYKFSSYKTILSKSKTNLKRSEVIEIFDDLDNFIYCHKYPAKFDSEF